MISQFFLISARGDTLIARDLRGDLSREMSDVFLNKLKEESSLKPVFNVNGVNFFHTKLGGLQFVLTCKDNVSPAFMMELLQRISRIIKDYCGTLTEDAVRKNFILIYELLDEILDYGYPQALSTELLKAYVYNEPAGAEGVAAHAEKAMSTVKGLVPNILQDKRTLPSAQANKPMAVGESAAKSKENTIFVDVYERLHVTVDANGNMLHGHVEGSLQLRSFLATSTELRLSLNDGLQVLSQENPRGFQGNNNYGSSQAGGPGGPALPLDDVNFHECVKGTDFQQDQSLVFVPPDGEFTLLNYRIASPFRPPIIICPIVEDTGPFSAELIIRVKTEFEETKHAANFVLTYVMPRHVTSCSLETDGSAGQTADYNKQERLVTWKVTKFKGQAEHIIRAKLMFDNSSSKSKKKFLSPVSINFELPMLLVSNIQVLSLEPCYGSSGSMQKWIRYITQTHSYVCRMR